MTNKMVKSEHGSLTAALAAFQAELPKVAKNAVNPYHNSKFADLGEVTHKVLPLLVKHGLVWVTMPTMVDGKFVLKYSLEHTSGGALSGWYPLSDAGTPQQRGSEITYARRYALMAVTGVVADDDDGRAAVQQAPAAPQQAQNSDLEGLRQAIANAASSEQLAVIHKQASDKGVLTPEVSGWFIAKKRELKASEQ